MSAKLEIKLKRAYEPPSPNDGLRVLVERLWPRGLTKEAAKIERWYKELAPSTELRKWYGHHIERWESFCARYKEELLEKQIPLSELYALCQHQQVTFIYAAKDIQHNSALVLKSVLETMNAS